MWNPSGNGIDPNLYYPGDAAVDWIAFDWYDTFNLYFDTIYRYSFDPKTGTPDVDVPLSRILPSEQADHDR